MLRIHILAGKTLDTTEDGAAVVPPADAKGRRWFEAVAPTAEELAALAGGLGLHELALEDALATGHPPKLEEFGDVLFLIAHTPDEEAEGGTRKIALFLNKHWIATILRAPLERVHDVSARVRADPARYLDPPASLAHFLLDQMTDSFEVEVEEIGEAVEALEERTGDSVGRDVMAGITEQRRRASQLRRIVRSQRDVCTSLARSAHDAFPKRFQPYLRDVADHLVRVHDLLEGVRDALGAARDAYLSAVNNRLSEIMRVLTVIATVMMPLSLLAGIFGMNFQRIPGAASPAGFWVLLGTMAALATGMLLWFRRRGWL